MSDAPAANPVRVWDLPTRLFHWSLVALVVASYVTAQLDELDWHMRSGECILALLVFRLLWGVLGSDTARFAHFLRGPRAVWRHLFWPHEEPPHIGHNPAGGWAVAAMLFFLCVQVVTGLFADDDISETGPLGGLVSHATRKFLTFLHHRNINILFALVVLHLAAIATYRFVRRQDLLRPMITGVKPLPAEYSPPRMRGLLLAGVIFAVAAGLAVWIASFGD